MAAKVIRQNITLNTTPDKVYEAFLDSRRHTAIIGSKAKMSRRPGAEFSVYDGYAIGNNVELIPNQLIRQSWRVTDWPEEAVSEIKLELEKTHLGTRIVFSHKNVPPQYFDSIKQGWIDFYWIPMKKYFSKK